MGPAAYALPSPLPTTPPDPRDVHRKLLIARQEQIETCAWIDQDPNQPQTCDLGSACIYNTLYSDYFCCDSSSFADGLCGVGPTTCLDSTQVPLICDEACLLNTANIICTEGVDTYCRLKTFLFHGGLTAWACGPEPGVSTGYDFFTNGNGEMSSATVGPAAYGFVNTLSNAAPSSTVPPSSPASSPVRASSPSSPTPVPASGLSTGAKAGIAVGAIGAVAIIAGLIFFIILQKRRSNRQGQQNFTPNQPVMTQQPQPPPPQAPLAASPTLTQQQHMSMTSNPSATSTTPLTQANMRAMTQSPPPPSEILPSESASQIHSPTAGASVLSGPTSPGGYIQSSSNTGSQEHSALGPLPSYPTGASAFPHGGPTGGQSVLSNPNTFLSSPPVHAPGLDHYGGGQE